MKIHCSHDELVPITHLKPHPKNRNKHPDDQIRRLADILEYQGWRYPIKVSKLSGFITSGHGRLMAAKLLGLTEVPVNFQEYLSEEQEYADLTADNAIAAWAEIDLAGINADLADLGPDLNIDLLGLKDFVLEPADKLAPGCDEDEVPEHVEPITKPGDLYILGNHRLLCGDATNIEHVERLMDGEKADMVFTDPPYNVASHSKMHAGDGSAWFGKQLQKLKDSEWDKDFDVRPAVHNLFAIAANDCSFYIWTSQYLVNDIWQILTPICDYTAYTIWNKTNPMPSLAKRHWTWSVELCVYATRGKHVFNFPDEGNCPNVWTMPKKSDGSHPTQKPIELCEHVIVHSSKLKQRVADLFGGSGSTLIACEKTNRKCYMMELDPHYCDVIVARWEKFTGKKAERIDG